MTHLFYAISSLHKLTHASENDNNKNDNNGLCMNLLQRQSIMIKVLNRKKPITQTNAHITQIMCEWIIKSPQPKPMHWNKFQGEIRTTVFVMCVHAQKLDTTSGLPSQSKNLFTKMTTILWHSLYKNLKVLQECCQNVQTTTVQV